jgi:hypothetical protein
MFEKKEQVVPKDIKVEELLTKLHELHPDKKYLLWFEHTIDTKHVRALRDALDRSGLGNVLFVAGIENPKVYEFEDK